jgi:hypothetical protein
MEHLSATERRELERLLERIVRGMGIDDNAPTPMFFEGEERHVRRPTRTRVPGARARSRG